MTSPAIGGDRATDRCVTRVAVVGKREISFFLSTYLSIIYSYFILFSPLDIGRAVCSVAAIIVVVSRCLLLGYSSCVSYVLYAPAAEL